MNLLDTICRLDHFYRKYLDKNKKYNYLLKIIIKVFAIAHRQAQIEEGFSDNKEIVVENLRSKCLCAQCQIARHNLIRHTLT